MLGDGPHQSLVMGEAASSPLASLSRRSTFDEDSFFSPAKQKSDHRGTRPIASPQQVHKLPTVHDKVLQWFLDMIENRRLRTSVCTGIISAFFFFSTLVALQFSIFSPLRFFIEAFSCIFAMWSWISSAFIGTLCFAMSWVLQSLLAKPEQPKRLSWMVSETWLGLLTVLLYNVVYSILVMKLTRFSLSDGFLAGLILQSSVLAAFSSIFRNDFQLNFSGSTTQLGLLHTISGMFSLGYESVLVSSLREAARIATITAVVGCLFGLFSYGWASLLLIFNVWFHTYDIVIVFGQLFATKALLKLVRHIVMRPISFPLPPSFVVHTPTPEQTRTLTVVLESQSSLLKLFAFTDLRRIAWTDRNRRLEVFSLSQPGGHPRNWTNISSACINVLERIRNELQNVSSRLESYGMDKDRGDLSDDDFAEVDREMLMMPHKSRKQLYSSAVRQRHRIAIRPVPGRPEKVFQQPNNWWKRIIPSSGEQEVVSRYDTNIVILAIESLYMFVVESYQEDRYGVVLKDLPGIIGVLVQLIQTIDKYFRLKANHAAPSNCDSNVKLIDATLQAALLRISGKFGEHFKALDLSREQLQTIKMVCQSDI